MKKSIKKIIKLVIPLILRPVAVMWFWFLRWFRHNRFLSGLNNKKIGSPSFIYLPFSYFYNLLLLLRRSWAEDFADYALKRYKVFLKIHYSKEGLGYFDYGRLSPDDCLKIYQEQKGRIAYYITHNPTVLDYKDGGSFLDAGCGMGQNIKELVARYPNSLIKGFDVSEEALKIIQIALKDNRKISVEVGDVGDFNYLSSYPTGAFDHVVISHVLAFFVDSGIEETRKIRQTIIDQLVRIAGKTLLILDGGILSRDNAPEIIIEHKTRCTFKESLIPYFSKHFAESELYAMFSPEDEAIVFKLNK